MAKISFQGLTGYVRHLNRLADAKTVRGTIKMAVYPGADIIANEIRKNLTHVLEGNSYIRGADGSTDARARTGDLLRSLYLSPMQDEDGYIYSQIGYAGYDPHGVPNALKAAALEHGTSRNGREYQPKTPFVRPALKAAKAKAEAAMAAELGRAIRIIMED